MNKFMNKEVWESYMEAKQLLPISSKWEYKKKIYTVTGYSNGKKEDGSWGLRIMYRSEENYTPIPYTRDYIDFIANFKKVEKK